MQRLVAAILAFGIIVASPVAFAQQTGTTQSGTTLQQPVTGTSKAPATKQAVKTKKDLTPQQKKMSDCSHEAKAKGFKGDQRKQFMSTCLKSE